MNRSQQKKYVAMLLKMNFTDATAYCESFNLPEEMAYQYFKYNYALFSHICDVCTKTNFLEDHSVNLTPANCKALLKNKTVLGKTSPDEKVWIALRTLDLDWVKPRLEHCDVNLQKAFFEADCVFKDAADFILKEKKYNPAVNDNEAIIDASSNGCPHLVARLLADERVDPAAQNNLAIVLAAGFGHFENVKLLLQDSRVNPADQNNEAIIFAARKGHLNVIKALLKRKDVNPGARNNAAVTAAINEGHFRIAKLIMADRRFEC
jgi:hypothetical protein